MIQSGASPLSSRRNWAGNVIFAASAIEHPRSLEELRRLVSTSPRVHALGAGHSFSDAADTSGVLVVLDEMPRLFELDSIRGRVRIDSAARYADLGPALHRAGLALANLASLPHLSVTGASRDGDARLG